MDINRVTESLERPLSTGFALYERRPGSHQLILPIYHEDGDMVEVYLADSPKGEDFVRICDFGLTLMRLSYTYEISTSTRRQLFDSILINNGVDQDEGSLYLDAPIARLYEGVLQFAGCAQKVCNLRYWTRESTRTAFYEDLEECITTDLSDYSPAAKEYPIPGFPIGVDWSLTFGSTSFYLFGVHSDDKAKNVALALLEYRKESLTFISLIVHEEMQALGTREQIYLTRNADKQYPALADFRSTSVSDIFRLSGAVV